jgi:putative Holliday junction resolvase
MTDKATAGTGRIMALDYGDRRIGVALSDPLGLTASPLTTIERGARARDLEALRRLVEEHGVTRIVVGWPLAMDGSRTERVRLTEAFMERVRRATGLPITPWDERLTTVQAERVLIEGGVRRERRREVIDRVAAVILLQSYLDAARIGERA